MSKTIGMRPPSLALHQRRLQLVGFAIGRRGEPLAFERLAAAQAVHRVRVDDVEAGLAQQAVGHHRHRVLFGTAARRPHRSRRAAREIDDRAPMRAAWAARADAGIAKPAARGIAGRHSGILPAGDATRGTGERAHRAGAEQSVDRVRAPETGANASGHGAEMRGDGIAGADGDRARAATAQRLDELAGLDRDRTRGRAEAASRAGLDAVIVVQLAQRGDRRLVPPSGSRSSRAISRQPTMRCRGDSVSARDGHITRRTRTRCTCRPADRRPAAASGS